MTKMEEMQQRPDSEKTLKYFSITEPVREGLCTHDLVFMCSALHVLSSSETCWETRLQFWSKSPRVSNVPGE